jgi:lipopolysaccharide export system protein LptA
MTDSSKWPALLAAAVALTLAAPVASVAQPRNTQKPHAAAPKQQPAANTSTSTSNVPNAMQGFSKNRHEPIQIDAGSLEVQDKDKIATFRGKVHVVQGDTELRCNVLVVYYEQEAEANGSANKTAPAPVIQAPSEGQRIRKLEAKGNVVITQKDQVATGDNGEFDMRKNMITLTGNVAVNQGRSVLRGDKLTVDMTTGVSHMEASRGRVQGLFQPSKGEDQKQNQGSGILPNMR